MRAAFLCLHYRFILYWHKPTGAKAAHRMLMKFSPGLNYTNFWCKAQMCQCTEMRSKDAILNHQQNFTQLYQCKELERTTNFYNVRSMLYAIKISTNLLVQRLPAECCWNFFVPINLTFMRHKIWMQLLVLYTSRVEQTSGNENFEIKCTSIFMLSAMVGEIDYWMPGILLHLVRTGILTM